MGGQTKVFLVWSPGSFEGGMSKKIRHDKLKTKLIQNKPTPVKNAWYQAGTSLTKLLSNLSVQNLDDFKCYNQFLLNLLTPTFILNFTKELQVVQCPKE